MLIYVIWRKYDVDYFQGYRQNKEAFRALTKIDILKPYIPDNDFRKFNEGFDVGYNLYVFEIRNHKNLEAAQPYKKDFVFSEDVSAGRCVYVSISTDKMVSFSSDGQRHFGLVRSLRVA